MTGAPLAAPPSRLALVRLTLVLAGGLLLLWISLGVTLTMVAGATRYQAALQLWPWGTISNTAKASAVIGAGTNADAMAHARDEAVRAVSREPANVQAVRTVALIDAQGGRSRSADRLMDYAQTLSRRDLLTEMYLIERNVQADNIGGALQHYDHALRTSRKSADFLMPVLEEAISEPSVRVQLSDLLRENPAWRYDFFSRVLTGASDLRALDELMRGARLHSGEPGGATFTRQLVDRLISANRYVEAFRAYRHATGKTSLPMLRDGGFETSNEIPPIEWWFSDDASLYAVRETVSGASGNYALRIIAKDGGRGIAARQLVMLAPGSYQLTARVGGGEGAAQFTINVLCADTDRVLKSFTATLSDQVVRAISLNLTVSNGCPAQWLTLSAISPDLGQASFWIDDMAFRRSN